MNIFTLEHRQDETGDIVPTLIKRDELGREIDEWCNVKELDQLFEACVSRWGKNWNLEKVMVAIRESQID